MVDALALGASGETHGGSSPLLGTFIIFRTLAVRKIIKEKLKGLEKPEARLALRPALEKFQQKFIVGLIPLGAQIS